MCSCEPGYLCHDCAGTRHDPSYFDVGDFEQPAPEPVSPSEFE